MALRCWTLCPAYVLKHGTVGLTKHVSDMIMKINKKPTTATSTAKKEFYFIEKNNEVAVQWMIMKTIENILLEHPTSLDQDYTKWKMMSSSNHTTNEVHDDKRGRRINPVVSPDHLLLVKYTSWVKRSLHLSLLTSMKSIFNIYVHAVHYWMQQDEKDATVVAAATSSMERRSNVVSYNHWLNELEDWYRQWGKWYQNVVDQI
jgi:hypothetical protein